MALFPKIQSPCPYIDRLSSIMEGDTCRMCKRQVFDLTGMNDGERVAFLKSCSGEICVSYRFTMRPALAAAAMAVAIVAAPVAASACDDTEVLVVTGGGIKDPANVQFVQTAQDSAVPQIPIVYDDAQAPGGKPAKSN